MGNPKAKKIPRQVIVEGILSSRPKLFGSLDRNLAELLHEFRKLQSRLASTRTSSLVVLYYLGLGVNGKVCILSLNFCY